MIISGLQSKYDGRRGTSGVAASETIPETQGMTVVGRFYALPVPATPTDHEGVERQVTDRNMSYTLS